MTGSSRSCFGDVDGDGLALLYCYSRVITVCFFYLRALSRADDRRLLSHCYPSPDPNDLVGRGIFVIWRLRFPQNESDCGLKKLRSVTYAYDFLATDPSYPLLHSLARYLRVDSDSMNFLCGLPPRLSISFWIRPSCNFGF